MITARHFPKFSTKFANPSQVLISLLEGILTSDDSISPGRYERSGLALTYSSITLLEVVSSISTHALHFTSCLIEQSGQYLAIQFIFMVLVQS